MTTAATSHSSEATTLADRLASMDMDGEGRAMHEYVVELYPICRSITGDGVRATLAIIGAQIPLETTEVPTGTPVLDWQVPNEWNCRAAWIRGPDGRTVVDFADHTLHVQGYSVPIHARMSLEALQPHLHSLPEHPDWIPYRTAYYQETWGFCLPHCRRQELKGGMYEVFIDASLAPGHLTYGECILPGATDQEVLISAHVCHPSLCNDNLSGIAVATRLARSLQGIQTRYTYRFLFIPATIGSLAWLATHEDVVPRIRHGLILAGVGDPGAPTYKQSRRGDADIDRAAAQVLARSGSSARVFPFSPYGYDERQFCSPGYNLPVGCLMRTPFGEYPEYHSSADNPDLVKPSALADTLRICLQVLHALEGNKRYLNANPKGEPQLGSRGLYDLQGGRQRVEDLRMALLWVLNQSDGYHDLLDIADRADLAFETIRAAADMLIASGLLTEAAVDGGPAPSSPGGG
jgi:aminopeptidase-like protein